MQTNSDFRDLFAELNAAKAEYLVVDALAIAAHGHVRATKDLDVSLLRRGLAHEGFFHLRRPSGSSDLARPFGFRTRKHRVDCKISPMWRHYSERKIPTR